MECPKKSDLTRNRFLCFKSDYAIYGTHLEVDEYGTEKKLIDTEPKFTIHVMWTPVTDEVAWRSFGPDTERMLQCVYYDDDGNEVKDGDRLYIRNNQYEIVSVRWWNTHRILRAKQILPKDE